MFHRALLVAVLAPLFVSPLACKDLKIEDPMIKHRAVQDDESQRQDAAFTRTFSDTHCPRANTTLVRRPDIAADVYDVTACGNQLRYECSSETASTRNAYGEKKAAMVYECKPFQPVTATGAAAPPTPTPPAQ